MLSIKEIAIHVYRIFNGTNRNFRKLHVTFGKNVSIDRQTQFEGRTHVNDNSSLSQCFIGYGSYIAGSSKFTKARIGRFCSIGQNVRNSFGRHPAKEFVSTHPAFFSTKRQAGFTFVQSVLFNEHVYSDIDANYLVTIGNDVWLANQVMIMDGINIADGSIIGLGSIVTKDTEPYGIYTGAPAKLLRKRFSDREIEFLLKFKWWDKDFEWLQQHVHLFTSITKFMGSLSTD